MKEVANAGRLLVILGLALIALVAVTHPFLGLLLVFLIPTWFFFAALVGSPLPRLDIPYVSLPVLTLPIFSSRPPPLP